MTENEALKIAIHCLGVQAEQEVCEECPVYRENGIVCKEIARTAIFALKGIQQYREIGTVEECREAVGKKIPKMPKFIHMIGRYTAKFRCPVCGKDFNYNRRDKEIFFCKNCGQALKMEGEQNE